MDQQLVERARDGDHDAFEALIVAVANRLMGVAVRILRDRDLAEDAVQAAIIAAWRDLPLLRDASRFESWIGRILVNACYTEHRSGRRRDVAIARLRVADPEPDLLRGLVDRDTLDRAFRHVPVEQRAVLVYRYYLGMSVDDIALELAVPAGTVKSRLHYATSALRAAIEADARASSTREAMA